MRLNGEQQAAVEQRGNLLLLAGAGSGKTLVLAHRSAALIHASGEGHLVAVTFTKEGARELGGRIRALVPGKEKRVISGTFHSLALRQLKEAGVPCKILDDGGRRLYLNRSLAYTEESIDIDELEKTLDETKSRLTHDSYSGPGAKTITHYQKLLDFDGYMDFGDVIIRAVEGMRRGSVPPIKMRWLLGDEFQDTDEAQYAWIRMHHEMTNAEVTLVGDDDQSIYSFRHAMGYAGMQRFTQEFGATTRHLSNNYRCAPEVLLPAARLVSHNEHRAPKHIIPANPPGGVLELIRPAHREEENLILTERFRKEPGGWAVLARTNRLLDELEVALQSSALPYIRLGGTGFWDRYEAKAILSILEGILAGSKWVSMPEVRNPAAASKNPLRSQASATKVRSYKTTLWHGIRTAMQLAGIETDLAEYFSKLLHAHSTEEWAAILHKEKDAIQEHRGETPKRCLSSTIAFLELVHGWCLVAGQDTTLMLDAFKRWVSTLLPSIAEPCGWALTALSRLRGTLSQRIAFVSGKTPSSPKPDVVIDPNTIVLATMHASKGLEWPKVCVIGIEDGVCPHLDGGMEEERRLLYVAMTRARNLLILSSVREGTLSPFIIECGLETDR
ncbi:ATP-dependent helicase [Acidithiobacillus ferridurans]|uniref:DNA 3'-5' helicase n=1 Tax=Acidithiobacillus ferridurans TaxID=1232575 RepID=A0A8X8GBR1_ACIFI|nr:ATP-dependent helicase [Acidithiobacillus ferridurans]MBU2715101.1 ATP-dependent helicase [Acidithiobacillus ferridurans]MBU2723898.1 ATP-dependent helicase [Acidithiobacillus ferridurans]MBU2727957.1 ATP-dependent helicase [Acidithiobacillus ferridurans]